MAAPPKKPKKSPTIPQTAEEKSARAALVEANRVGLEAQQVRAATQSKGAYRSRTLRAGGTELARYNLGRFTDDPTPPFGGTTGGGGNPGGAPSAPRSGGTTKRRAKPKTKPKKPLRGPSRGGRGGDRPGADLNRGAPKPKKPVTQPRATDVEARREAEAKRQAEERRKREIEASKRRNKKQARTRTGGGRGAFVE